MIIFVTDHRLELPEGISLLAVGTPFDNCGFIGLTTSGTGWRALVKNYGKQMQTRRWSIDGAEQGELQLQPGEARELAGGFPENKDATELSLSGDRFAANDRFPMDDRLPIVRPQIKPLGLCMEEGTAFDDFFKRFAASLGNLSREETDLMLGFCGSSETPEVAVPAILFLDESAPSEERSLGLVVAVHHPLTADLNWQSLICEDGVGLGLKEGDEVLLWQGDRPLIFLRGPAKKRSLVINFDLRHSNATRIPAFVLLLNRFAEQIRAGKSGQETVNVETNQLLAPGVRAPCRPGFFEKPLLKAAAHFADAREADFSAAASFDGTAGKLAKQVEHNSEQDFLTPVWLLLFCAACLGSWAWIERRS